MKKSFGAVTLIVPRPVWCVGSYDKKGRVNVMTIAWAGICCSKPPCVTISLRKATYTYGNIMGGRAYNLATNIFGKPTVSAWHPAETWTNSRRLG
jgi:flavin reductase (DIM6/NTAB) family NADH-FMN oxidoreductase RutF